MSIINTIKTEYFDKFKKPKHQTNYLILNEKYTIIISTPDPLDVFKMAESVEIDYDKLAEAILRAKAKTKVVDQETKTSQNIGKVKMEYFGFIYK
jgi:hypothetical protein